MTTFLFVRHGEPDYDSVGSWSRFPFGKDYAGLTELGKRQIEESCRKLANYGVDIIVSSPYTRTMQGAAIMSRLLDADVAVENDLHEWEVDLTHTVTEEKDLLALCKEHDKCGGIYPNEVPEKWESTELVHRRVWKCLEKYRSYSCVVVSGHAMMMQAALGVDRAIGYGEILSASCENDMSCLTASDAKKAF